MERFIDTKNFILKYLVLELFEKLHRLKKFINTCTKFDRKNNTGRIISLYNESIHIIGLEINDLCTDIETDLTNTEKFAIIIKISIHSKAIVKIHEELRNLHSSWILPEIKTFANDVIKEESSIKDINIILSDNYSFLERNLGKKFEYSLQQVYGVSAPVETIKENHTFILPKIEFSNPLNWTIIAHEAGHLQRDVIDNLRENPEIMPDSPQSLDEKKIKNWAEEIYCDLYATSLLGPAYFISFVSFALLSSLDYGIMASSEIHPSTMIRACIIINFLKDNNLTFETEWGQTDYSKVFFECLINQSNVFKDESKNTVPGLTKFNRNLRRAIKELKLNGFSIQEHDSKRIQKLVEKLAKGIPIGGVCDEISFDWKSLLEKSEMSLEDLKKLKNTVTERSCKIWEILNTAWVFKIENNCKKGAEIFFTNGSNSIMEKIQDYGEIIDHLDDRLLASINSAQIIKIIEQDNGIVS
jgi:hypothetical protein